MERTPSWCAIDAIDEKLEAFRSGNPNGRRNRRVLALGLLSAAVAVLIRRATLGGVETRAWQGLDSPDWAGASSLLFLLAPLAVLRAVRKRESVLRYAVGTLLVPVLSLGVGVVYSDERRAQLEARDVFGRYTSRFPEGRLHGVYVPEQTGRYVTVCANEGPQDPNDAPDDRQFCLEIHVRSGRGEQVQGGYRFNRDDGAEFGFGSHDFFDCFGDPIQCPE